MASWSLLRNNRIVLALACVMGLALLLVSELSYRESIHKLDELERMAQVHVQVRDLQEHVLEAESVQRGYLLTGYDDYLAPFALARQQVDAALRQLQGYYGADPRFGPTVRELGSAVQDKLDEMALTMALYREGRREAAKALVASGIGAAQMQRIRALDAQLLEQLRLRSEEGRSGVYRTLQLGRIGVALLSAMGLLALFLFLRQTLALRAQQPELKRVVQAERDRLETEVEQRTAQLRELTRHLLSAREDERSRLARDLHDDLGSLLTSAKLDAARIRSRLAAAPQALELLEHLVRTLNQGIALGRRIIEDLRPSALSNLGLQETLSIAAREFTQNTGVPVLCDLGPAPLDAAAELMVYRLVQEAFTNISKYAAAGQVWLALQTLQGVVQLSVRDDGVGFDASAKPRSAYGLMGMRFRVEAEGGTLSVQSAPGAGTLILARLAQRALSAPSYALDSTALTPTPPLL